MDNIVRLRQTSPEKIISSLPAPDDLVDIICIYRCKTGGPGYAHSEMKIETLAYYVNELRRLYDREQAEQGF